MDNIKRFSINWNRSIIIDSVIDDDLIKRITPIILQLRQDSDDPITVGIDSPGGSLASLDILLGLLTGPNQNRNKCDIITVVTHRAYSAAANMLAFGNYAIALSHAQILYHDVRYGGMEDITPEKARDAAKWLQDANDTFSLKLAHRVIKRLLWTYICLQQEFDAIRKKYPDVYNACKTIIDEFVPSDDSIRSIDLASFATSLWSKLSSQNDVLILNVMERLKVWINHTAISTIVPTYREEDVDIPGILDGAKHLYEMFEGRLDFFQEIEKELKLMLGLIVADIAKIKGDSINFSSVLDRSVREYGALQSMNNQAHISYALSLMKNYKSIFIEGIDVAEFDRMGEDEKNVLYDKAIPYARLIWYFCVLLCRELFEGEHILNPSDSQLLGLVDEVSGGGPIKSIRDYYVEKECI